MLNTTNIHGHRRWLLHIALACGSIAAGASQSTLGQATSAETPTPTPTPTSVVPVQLKATPTAENTDEAKPNPSTERSVVFRRLCIDILGRLPTAQELEEFLKDKSPQAYGKAVDRLMTQQLQEEKEKKTNALTLKVAPEEPRRTVTGWTLLGNSAKAQEEKAKAQEERARAERERARAEQAEAAARLAAEKLDQTNHYGDMVRDYYRLRAATAAPGSAPHPAPPLPTAVRAAFVGKAVKSAYLGVGVETPGDTLRAQLKLAEGAGLVVNYVDDSGPSKGLIHQHDVLQKINDQILVNGEQFQTLVRMHKTGDSVKVTLIREAKPITVEVKLGERQTADAGQANPSDITFANTWNVADAAPWQQNVHDYVTTTNGNVLNWTTAANATPTITAAAFNPTGNTLAVRALRTGPIRVDDGSWTIVLPAGDGQDMTLLESASGNVVYRGPVITSEEDPHAQLLPPEARKKIIVWRKALNDQGVRREAVLEYRLEPQPVLPNPTTQPSKSANDADPKSGSARDEVPPSPASARDEKSPTEKHEDEKK